MFIQTTMIETAKSFACKAQVVSYSDAYAMALASSSQQLRSLIVIKTSLSELSSGGGLSGSDVSGHPRPGVVSNGLTGGASELIGRQHALSSGREHLSGGVSSSSLRTAGSVLLSQTVQASHAHGGSGVELLLAEKVAVDNKDEQKHNQDSSQHSVSRDQVGQRCEELLSLIGHF
jgi:hypothetical protein